MKKIAFVSLLVLAGALVATSVVSTSGASARIGAVVGKIAPDFTLLDADGKKRTLSQYRGKTVVLEWTNSGCHFAKRHARSRTMQNLVDKYAGKGVAWLAVNSTADNTPESSRKWVRTNGLTYPILQDSDGTVGKVYGARTTPHMFVIDARGVLRYAGAIDDNPQGKAAAPINYVSVALEALTAGKDPSPAQTEPYGCSVRYKQ